MTRRSAGRIINGRSLFRPLALWASDRSAPVLAWLRRQPRLRAAVAVWDRLLDEFCAAIAPLLSRFHPDRRLIAVVTPSGTLDLHVASRGTVSRVQNPAIFTEGGSDPAPSAWSAVELRLRPDQVLLRSVSLPASSRDFVASILEHRLERLTPWRRDRVLYGFRIVGESDQGSAISVALTATSTDLIAAPLHALRDLGLSPTAIGSDPVLETPLAVNLVGPQVSAGSRPLRRLVARVWLSAFAVLCLSVLGASLWRSNAESEQGEAHAHLIKARKLLKIASLGTTDSQVQTVLAEKTPDRSTMVLIDRLATAIPSNTFLHDMAITPQAVRLAGVSADAPALIPLLETIGLLDVRFSAPVTRDKDNTDGFEIVGERRGPSPETP